MVRVHTVIRWTSNRRQIAITLSPFRRAVRIASTSFGVSGVRDRLAGFNTTPDSGSAARGSCLSMPGFAYSHAELSLSSRSHVFGLSPPASTIRRPGPYGSGLRRRGGGLAVETRRSRPGCGPASIAHRRRTALSRQALGGQTRGVPTRGSRTTGASEAGAAGPVRPTQ